MSLVLNRSRQVPADETPAFGGIAERFRRAGDLERAVALCRDGLKKFPDHLSARVTLGWALLDLGRYDEAQVELEQVLKRAPDNLAAIRGLAELHERAENAVVVPMDSAHDTEAVEAARALEASLAQGVAAAQETAPVEEAPPVPPAASVSETSKRAKTSAPAVVAEPAVVEEVVAPAAPAKPPAVTKKDEPAASVEEVPPVAVAVPVPMPQSAVPVVETVAPVVEPTPTSSPSQTTSTPSAEAVAEPALDVPEVPALDLLSAEFGALAATESAASAPVEEAEPVNLAETPIAVIDDPVLPASEAPVADELPHMVDELLGSTGADHVVPEVVVDLPLEAEPAALGAALTSDLADFVLDAPAPAAATFETMAPDDIQPTSEAEPAEPDITQATMLAAEAIAAASTAHPQPDVTELAAAPAADSAEASAPAVPVDHPAVTSEFHHPDIGDVAAPQVVQQSTGDSMEAAPVWSASDTDFLAAVEASTKDEPIAPETTQATVDDFLLTGESPSSLAVEEFHLASEPVAEIEAAADQSSMLELVVEAGSDYEPPLVPEQAAPLLDFEAPDHPPEPVSSAPPTIEVASPTIDMAPPAPVAASPFAEIAAAVSQPAAVARPSARASVKTAKLPSAKVVVALEKMLRRINARRAQVASEYRG